MPSPEKRVRVERGLYKTGNLYYACATPPGSRSAIWRALGAVNLMEAQAPARQVLRRGAGCADPARPARQRLLRRARRGLDRRPARSPRCRRDVSADVRGLRAGATAARASRVRDLAGAGDPSRRPGRLDSQASLGGIRAALRQQLLGAAASGADLRRSHRCHRQQPCRSAHICGAAKAGCRTPAFPRSPRDRAAA